MKNIFKLRSINTVSKALSAFLLSSPLLAQTGSQSSAAPQPGVNDIIVTRSLGGKLMSHTKTTYEEDLSKVTTEHSDGSKSIVVYGTSDTNGELPFHPKSITDEFGTTSYNYTAPEAGGMVIVTTFQPIASTTGKTITTTVLRPDMSLAITETIIDNVLASSVYTSGHETNTFQQPTKVVFQEGAVIRTQRYTYHSDGNIKNVTSSDGNVTEFKWDGTLDRLTESTTNGRKLVPDYSGGTLKAKATYGGKSLSSEYNVYGEQLTSDSDLSGGAENTLTLDKGKRELTFKNKEQDRSKTFEAMLDGTPQKISGGLGSTGVSYEYSTEDFEGTNCFKVEATLLDEEDKPTKAVYATYYDGEGRVICEESPHPMAGDGTHDSKKVQTKTSYDIKNRSITITPPAPEKKLTITYSKDWRTVNYTQGGVTYENISEITNGISTNTIKYAGQEIRKTVSDFSKSTSTSSYYGKNPVKTTFKSDGNEVTVKDNFNNEFTIQSGKDGIKEVRSQSQAVQNSSSITARHPTGEVKQIELQYGNVEEVTIIDFTESGEIAKITGPEIDITPQRDFSNEGRKDTFENKETKDKSISHSNKVGEAREDSQADKPTHKFDGSIYKGKMSRLVAGQKVDYIYSHTFNLLRIERADGSSTKYTYHPNGQIDSITEQGSDGQITSTRTAKIDEATGQSMGYDTQDTSLTLTRDKYQRIDSATYLNGDIEDIDSLHGEAYSDFFENIPSLVEYTGVLAGFSVKRNFNPTTGDIQSIEVRKNDTPIHTLSYTTDQHRRVQAIRTIATEQAPFSATYNYSEGLVDSIQFNKLKTNTLYTPETFKLRGFQTTKTSSGSGIEYSSMVEYDSAHKNRRRATTNSGSRLENVTWDYDFSQDQFQLDSAISNQGDRFIYNPTAQGNRQGYTTNSLNQYTSYIFSNKGVEEGFKVEGRVAPSSTVQIKIVAPDSKISKDYTAQVSPEGEFSLTLSEKEVATFAQPNPNDLEVTVTGTLANEGDEGRDAKAQKTTRLKFFAATGSIQSASDGARKEDEIWEYTRNSDQKLVSMETKSSAVAGGHPNQKISFIYDANSRRIQKTCTTLGAAGETLRVTTTKFIYEGWDLLAEIIDDTQTGETIRTYTWGSDIDGSFGGLGGVGGLLGIHQDGKSYVPIYDALGNIIALTDDATGSKVAEWKRGPFGELISKEGTTELCPFGFATKYTDPESGLVYFGHRYFDTLTGHWLSKEPLGEGESFNLYAYCHNDPINKVDVLGLAEFEIGASEIIDVDLDITTLAYMNAYWSGKISSLEELSEFSLSAAFILTPGSGFSEDELDRLREYVTNFAAKNKKVKPKFTSNRSITRIPGSNLVIDWDNGKEAIAGFQTGLGTGATDLVAGVIFVAEENTNFYFRNNAYGNNDWSNSVYGYSKEINRSNAQLLNVDENSRGFRGFSVAGQFFSPLPPVGAIVKGGKTFLVYRRAGSAGYDLVEATGDSLKVVDNLAPKTTASDFARSWQGKGDYPGVDIYRDITLQKGKVIYGGAPGQSNFYTTASALKRADDSAPSLFQGLQVSPHPQFGYRPGVTAYEVIDDIPAAFGRTLANPQHGKGGLPQIVIENYEDYLRPIYSIPLKQ